MTDFVYSFACPFCHSSWKFEEFAKIAKDVFDSFEGMGTCPRCSCTFSWTQPGELDGRTADGKKWWELLDKERENWKHYKPHPCGYCGRKIDGKRKYCNDTCRSMAAYRRKHPEVKRVKKVKLKK